MLANPAVVNLYWHDEWDNAVANQNFLQAKIDAEVRGIMDGYYLNGADQYGVMRGRFVSSHQSSALCRPSRAPAVVDSLAILSWVTCQVSLPGTDVPIPLRDTIYMVFLPPGTVVRNPSRFAFDSCPPSPRPPGTIGFRGYHSGSIGWPYAVIPLSCHTGMETLTNTISHEIVEAATDPFGTGWLVGPPLSLSLPGVSVTKSQEAAHKCEDAPQGRLGPYWSNRSNQCITGLAPLARGNPLAYVTDDSVPRVVYRGADDHIEELRLEGSWNAADLSAMVGDGSPSVPAAGDPQAYTTPDLISRVVYRGQDSHIHELRLQGGWLQADLTAICAGNAVAVPAAGNPHAYVTPDSIPRVVYRGKDGHIHELRLQGSGWIHADLSAIVVNRAPVVPAVGDPYAYTTPDSIARVVYRGKDDHIHELRLQGGWMQADLSAILGNRAPAFAVAGDPFAYVTPDSIPRVIYRGKDDHIHELRLQGGWIQADLSTIVVNAAPAVPAAGNPYAYTTSPDSIPRVLYRGQDEHIHELRLQDRWIQADLSAIVTNGAPAVAASGDPYAYAARELDPARALPGAVWPYPRVAAAARMDSGGCIRAPVVSNAVQRRAYAPSRGPMTRSNA